ncbi:MAG TPA: PspA/IM30 family protein [Dokdonella sp.]
MSILAKILTLFRGAATEAGQAVVDRNATRILDQEIRDAQADSLRAKEELTKMMAQQKLAADKLAAKRAKKAEYESHIGGLLDRGDEALAREVAGKVAQLEGEIAAEQTALAATTSAIDKLHLSIKAADRRIEGLQQQVDQVKANESVLRAQAAVSARHGGQSTKLRTALDSLERVKARQAEQAARIEAADALAAADGDGDLEARLAAAGVTAGQATADTVLARFRRTEVVQAPRGRLDAPNADAAPLPAANERSGA